MKTLAAIRLLLATALMVLFSGTMAFAHSGHDHGTTSSTSASFASTANHSAKKLLAPAAQLSFTTAQEKPFFVLEARHVTPATSVLCGTGCCCCGGPSNCGMAGGCAAHALSLGQGLLAPAMLADSHLLATFPKLAGRDVAGPDRPPNA